MYAARIEAFDAPPRYRETSAPEPQEDEVLIQVRAAALSNLVRGQANGSHYSAEGSLPFTPGNDGVGITPDGTRVYFISPRAPFGSMAEQTVVEPARTIPLPATLDDATAAALGNPGIATWGALLGRAQFRQGESVLVNGATGIAGKQAVQVAKYLGAKYIVATGRDAAALEQVRELGADETILLTQPREALEGSFRSALRERGVDVVLDYLWGPSAEALLAAAAGHGSSRGEPRLRFIQIGSISGQTISLPAHLLRSTGVELLGSGLGSLSARTIIDALRTMYEAAGKTPFAIETEPVPLREVEQAWTRDTGDRRVVFIP